MKNKTDVSNMIPAFNAFVQRQYDMKIKCIRTDNGQEFRLIDFFAKSGIIHQLSCVEDHQQNGTVERKHQHILMVARSLMFHSKIPIKLWGEAVLTAIHVINRMPTKILKNKSPYELLYKKLPSYAHFKVFGYLCFVSTLTRNRKKLDERASKCVFLGFPSNVKRFRVYDLNAQRVLISRNVVFHEEIFPFQTLQDNTLE